MLAKVKSATVYGMEAYEVEVEVDISVGSPSFTIVGLPDTAIQESKERVRAGITNSEFKFPSRRITVNLAPADIRKEGPAFDLPIAIAILKAFGFIEVDNLEDYYFIGELSLNGQVRKVNGALTMALCARNHGKKALILGRENACEAALVQGIEIVGVDSLLEAIDFILQKREIKPVSIDPSELLNNDGKYFLDFSEIKGQEHVKRALEVSAAGGHNLLMIGPPGSGKTLMAQCLPTILPRLTVEEAIEVTNIYSVAGLIEAGSSLITKRPFRAPHHTISTAGLVGGGQHPKPGEITLSHQGVLFLDEFPEFRRDALEVLRQPLEERKITISRAHYSLTYPASFILVASMNPCRCGYYGDQIKECICTPAQIYKYRSKLSGPLLDRIDISVEAPRLNKDQLLRVKDGLTSKQIRNRVAVAIGFQRKRFKQDNINCNSLMSPKHMKKYISLNSGEERFISDAVDKLGISARSFDRILKVSRTIADLEGSKEIKVSHLAETIQYRNLDRLEF